MTTRPPTLDETRSAVRVAARLWLRPLVMCWRYYLYAVVSYLLFMVGAWALVTDQADLITSAEDARELIRDALLEAGPILALSLLVARAIGGLVRHEPSAWLEDLRYVSGVLERGLQRLDPSRPLPIAERAGRGLLVLVTLLAASFAIAALLDAALAAATVDTRYGHGPGWLLRNVLYIHALWPLGLIAGQIAWHWSAAAAPARRSGGRARSL